MRVSIVFPFGGLSLTWVGNEAPPMPTIPAFWIRNTISLGVRSSISFSDLGFALKLPLVVSSGVITTERILFPRG